MFMVAPDEGKVIMLDWLLHSDPVSEFPLLLVLYNNDYTPVDGSTYADFTHATFVGSDPLSLARSNWGPAEPTGSIAESDYVPIPEWTCAGGGPETCYGWLLYEPDSSTAVLAQRFDTPRVMDLGNREQLDPFRIRLKSYA